MHVTSMVYRATRMATLEAPAEARKVRLTIDVRARYTYVSMHAWEQGAGGEGLKARLLV